jgi:hypothetical protein
MALPHRIPRSRIAILKSFPAKILWSPAGDKNLARRHYHDEKLRSRFYFTLREVASVLLSKV